MFRYRNKLFEDVALEGMKNYLMRKRSKTKKKFRKYGPNKVLFQTTRLVFN